MALTKAQKAALKEEGLSAAELKKLEAILAAEDEDEGDSNGSKSSGKRVVVYEGDDAESFMAKMFGGSSSSDEGEDEDEDEDEGDEEPPSGPRWFRGKK